MSRFTLIIGPRASGKTTWAQNKIPSSANVMVVTNGQEWPAYHVVTATEALQANRNTVIFEDDSQVPWDQLSSVPHVVVITQRLQGVPTDWWQRAEVVHTCQDHCNCGVGK